MCKAVSSAIGARQSADGTKFWLGLDNVEASVIGTPVRGQWYAKYAEKHEIAHSKDSIFSLFLVTAGLCITCFQVESASSVD